MQESWPKVIVVVGSVRSGTTFLTGRLFNTLDAGIVGEMVFIMPLYRRLNRYGDLQNQSNLHKLAAVVHQTGPFRLLRKKYGVETSHRELVELIREPTYTGVLYATMELLAQKTGKSRLCYKNPNDVLHLETIARLLPSARFINMTRDGRDVALSLLKFDWGATNLYAGCRYWRRRILAGRKAAAQLGDRYMDVRLDDLVADPEGTGANLANFALWGTDPQGVERFVAQVKERSDPARVTVWRDKLSAQQVRVCEAACKEELRLCGYDVQWPDAQLSSLRSLYYVVSSTIGRIRQRIRRGLIRHL